ncbi:RidA family protein [Clostridium ganghwense]|uniref:RidA family protein n=1 Tax=Clostridium ganghwense TaxID=312089 RepID=A0ABT4CS07_9CLOT|nr:RidA family protein [Clostridium ganghwense]MCY6371850.1 RidA family protein [Clostridium ganghwense]
MEKQIINTSNAPSAIGPYSQAVKVGNLLFTSGQIPLNPQTGELVTDNIENAAEQVMQNLKAILEEAGTKFENVIKTTVLLRDINDFGKVNEVYAKYFSSEQPARSCFQVGKLPKDAFLEIEVTAIVE